MAADRDDAGGDDENGLEERLKTLGARLAGASPDITELIEAFLHQAEKDLATMRLALPQADGAALTEAAHSLSGSAAVLGANRLAESAGELATLARQGDLEACAALLPRVESDYQDAARRMK